MTEIFQSIPRDLLGQGCALLAAMTWACALVFFKLCGDRIRPLPMNLFKNTVATVLLALTLIATQDGFSTLGAFPIADTYILIISGFLGLALADTVFFYSLNLIGVSLFAIVDCAYSPIVLGVSWLMLSEELAATHYLGGALILAGLFLSTRHPPPANRTARQILAGVLLGLVSIFLMAVGIVLAKPVLTIDGFPLVWATTIRLVAGSALLALIMAASPRRREHFAVFRPARVWKHSIPGSIFGAYLAMVFWVGGFKYTSATLAAVLNQTSVIFATILAVVILKEKMTKRKMVSIVLAISGVLLITLAPT